VKLETFHAKWSLYMWI